MNPLNLALVAVGGAIGSVSRLVVSTYVGRALSGYGPGGTFAVNMIGCVLFGAILGAAEQRFVLTPELRAFVLVGVLGGFTTFSAFTYDNMALLQGGQVLMGAANIVGQVVGGLAGLWLAYAIAR